MGVVKTKTSYSDIYIYTVNIKHEIQTMRNILTSQSVTPKLYNTAPLAQKLIDKIKYKTGFKTAAFL